MPRHRPKKKSSTLGAVCGNDVVAPTKTKIQNGDWWSEHPLSKEGERMEQIWSFCLTDLNLRTVYLHPHAVISWKSILVLLFDDGNAGG